MRAPQVLEDLCAPLPWGPIPLGVPTRAQVHVCTHTLTLTDCPAGGQRGVHMRAGERGEEEVGDRDSDPQQHARPIAWEGGRQGVPGPSLERPGEDRVWRSVSTTLGPGN